MLSNTQTTVLLELEELELLQQLELLVLLPELQLLLEQLRHTHRLHSR